MVTSCQPATLKLNTPQTFLVTARNAVTSGVVAGKVLVDGIGVGATGAQLTHTFTARVLVGPAGGKPLPEKPLPTPVGGSSSAPELVDPIITVEATGYESAGVKVTFTGV